MRCFKRRFLYCKSTTITNNWYTKTLASRFLNGSEERFSVKEEELLGVDWSEENFQNYQLGKSFTVITDHRALLPLIKESKRSIRNQLRICKQKTTNVTFFETHCGRRPNTPLIKISTTTNSKKLN